MIINRASDLLDSGESAIVLFTRGLHLVINPDGSGRSGYWRINLKDHPHPDKVIIYQRLLKQMSLQGEIYLANYVDAVSIVEAPWQGRFVVLFQNAAQVGITNRNWPKFADTGSKEVRYLSKR